MLLTGLAPEVWQLLTRRWRRQTAADICAVKHWRLRARPDTGPSRNDINPLIFYNIYNLYTDIHTRTVEQT